MSSETELRSQAAFFLGRECTAFERLDAALLAQSHALRGFDVAALELRQVELESAVAETENAVFRRVKWQQEHFPKLPDPTWTALFEVMPREFKDTHYRQFEGLDLCSRRVKQNLVKNQSYTSAAREMLAALRVVERRVLQEKTDLYTSRGTLSGQVALNAVAGGAR